jgi:hypothetical protein
MNWLLINFVEGVPSAAHAIVVPADGLPLALSAGSQRSGRTSWPR